MVLLIIHADVDECALGFDKCDKVEFCRSDGGRSCESRAICTNTEGSYQCSCKPGFRGDGRTCHGNISRHSAPMVLHAYLPMSINRCRTTVSHSLFVCSTYADIDECALGEDICGTNRHCVNTPGSHECECVPGFVTNGHICTGM